VCVVCIDHAYTSFTSYLRQSEVKLLMLAAWVGVNLDKELIPENVKVMIESGKIILFDALWHETLNAGGGSKQALRVTSESFPVHPTYITEVSGSVVHQTPQVAQAFTSSSAYNEVGLVSLVTLPTGIPNWLYSVIEFGSKYGFDPVGL
jgi:hypothetical protein